MTRLKPWLGSRFPGLFLTVMVVLTVAVVGWLGWSVYDAYQHVRSAEVLSLRIQYLLGRIVYQDEVLTMSARMAAATSDDNWEARYLEYEPQLEQDINDCIDLAFGLGSESFSILTRKANERLVAMEKRAFEQVRAGHASEAAAVLAFGCSLRESMEFRRLF